MKTPKVKFLKLNFNNIEKYEKSKKKDQKKRFSKFSNVFVKKLSNDFQLETFKMRRTDKGSRAGSSHGSHMDNLNRYNPHPINYKHSHNRIPVNRDESFDSLMAQLPKLENSKQTDSVRILNNFRLKRENL